jgi:hypothetical protein
MVVGLNPDTRMCSICVPRSTRADDYVGVAPSEHEQRSQCDHTHAKRQVLGFTRWTVIAES